MGVGQRCPRATHMTKDLYDPSFEHDACGVGMVADLTGRPSATTVLDALTILENLEHRGATGADVESHWDVSRVLDVGSAIALCREGSHQGQAADTRWCGGHRGDRRLDQHARL